MNKADIKLCIVIILISIILYFSYGLFKSNDKKKAVVYYDNQNVLEIDLQNKEEKTYTVKGFNGDVVIKSSNGKVKVDEENSPRHLCSIQGFISESYESIICLPNKVVIKIEDSNELDTIVR